MGIKIRSESLPDRCEVCHQSDCFDPQQSYCSRCCVKGSGSSLITPATLRPCPRCKGVLLSKLNGENILCQCANCQGIWLEKSYFEKLLNESVRENDLKLIEQTSKAAEVYALDRVVVQYLHCPNCDQLMNRVVFGRTSGIIIDICHLHGSWLDYGELQAVREFHRKQPKSQNDKKSEITRPLDQLLQSQRDQLQQNRLPIQMASRWLKQWPGVQPEMSPTVEVAIKLITILTMLIIGALAFFKHGR